MKERILQKSRQIETTVIRHRRTIHSYAETGFDTYKTSKYIFDTLSNLGLECFFVGNNGVAATIKGNGDGKCVLLRADIDALPIEEKSGVEFANNEGRMHGCGHDMHTASLLGAAEILCGMKSDINGTIKLLFQPAEEILGGAKNMIENGILENPRVDCAMTMHVLTSDKYKTGSCILTSETISSPSADFFEITIIGQGCHGSSPNTGIDPIPVACRIVTALDEIKTREVGIHEKFILTIGSINCGDATNVIPENIILRGTMRGYYKENTRNHIKDRMGNIIKGISDAFRCDWRLNFTSGCPSLILDEKLMTKTKENLTELLGGENVHTSFPLNDTVQGSEDFAYFSVKVPCVTLGLCAGTGSKSEQHIQLHNERLVLDEDCLKTAVAIFAYNAINLLE